MPKKTVVPLSIFIPVIISSCIGLLIFSWAYMNYTDLLVNAKTNDFQHEYLIHDWFRNGIIMSVGVFSIGLAITICKYKIEGFVLN